MWLWLDGCLCMGIRQWERWKRGQVLSRQRLPLYKECVFCGFSGQRNCHLFEIFFPAVYGRENLQRSEAKKDWR